jgi:hypothetical protein
MHPPRRVQEHCEHNYRLAIVEQLMQQLDCCIHLGTRTALTKSHHLLKDLTATVCLSTGTITGTVLPLHIPNNLLILRPVLPRNLMVVVVVVVVASKR